MSDPVLIAIVAAVPPMVTTLITSFFGWVKLRKQDTKMEEIHTVVNGKNDKLVAENGALREEVARLTAQRGKAA